MKINVKHYNFESIGILFELRFNTLTNDKKTISYIASSIGLFGNLIRLVIIYKEIIK